jgi:hypothetical protein
VDGGELDGVDLAVGREGLGEEGGGVAVQGELVSGESDVVAVSRSCSALPLNGNVG